MPPMPPIGGPPIPAPPIGDALMAPPIDEPIGGMDAGLLSPPPPPPEGEEGGGEDGGAPPSSLKIFDSTNFLNVFIILFRRFYKKIILKRI
jgi:hypothetical protein